MLVSLATTRRAAGTAKQRFNAGASSRSASASVVTAGAGVGTA